MPLTLQMVKTSLLSIFQTHNLITRLKPFLLLQFSRFATRKNFEHDTNLDNCSNRMFFFSTFTQIAFVAFCSFFPCSRPNTRNLRKNFLKNIFVCYDCLDLCHAESFLQAFATCFPSSLKQE